MVQAELQTTSQRIKSQALKLGFSDCGIAKAEPVDPHVIKHYKEWIQNGKHGNMEYLEKHFDKRANPQLLVNNAKSVISVILNYYPSNQQLSTAPQIAKYAYGKDYHKIIKKRLKKLYRYINTYITEAKGRIFTDSAPVLDKYWAQKSGLGWIGKNSLLINTTYGSYILIGELILDIELDYDTPEKQKCGSCTKCINHCPANAIAGTGIIDARKCLSYATIETGEQLSSRFLQSAGKWIFGCDICQDVCPWNQSPPPHNDPELFPHPQFLSMTPQEWLDLTPQQYHQLFDGKAIKRAGYQTLKNNIYKVLNPQP